MSNLPTGTLAYLLTDVVGSTVLWETRTSDMYGVMERHDELANQAVTGANGDVVRPRGEGDSTFAVFRRSSDALVAAERFNRLVAEEPWPEGISIQLRSAIHIGEMELRSGEYYGTTVNRCARIRAAANAGQILVSGAVVALLSGAAPPGLALYDLGYHRLKDLLRAEQIFALHRAAEPADSRPIKSLDAVPNNLPLRLTSFIGREGELEAISKVLETARLVTLIGTGGTGKTSVAIQVAADRVDQYAGGVWFVDLSSSEIAGRVVSTIASAMGASKADSAEPCSLAPLFGSEQTLLLLDNCERLVDEVACCASWLLQHVPNLTILATSRESLHVPGQHVIPVPAMSVASSPDEVPLEQLQELDSFRLFVERAGARKHGFQVTPSTAADIAAICKAVDGIPLAIEHVTSHVTSLTTKQIRERLSDRLALLKTKDHGIPKRHLTVRAMIAWSYETLCDEAKILFSRLAAFPAGWTLEAAEAICSGDDLDVYDLIQTLVDKSLVTVVEHSDGSTRFRYLDTIRQFASELDGRPSEALVKGFVDWYSSFAKGAYGYFNGPEQAVWLTALDRESENIVRALRWCEEICPGELLGFAVALRQYWYRRGRLSEGLGWLTRALELTDQFQSQTYAQALNAKATFEWQLADHSSSRNTFARALACYEALGDAKLVVGIVLNIAGLESDAGRPEAAMKQYAKAIKLSQKLSDGLGVAIAVQNMGITELDQGNLEKAKEYLTRCLPALCEHKQTNREAHTLVMLGEAQARGGESEAALESVARALELWPEIQDFLVLALAAAILVRVLHKEETENCARLCGAVEPFVGGSTETASGKMLARASQLVGTHLGCTRYTQLRSSGAVLGADGAYTLCLHLLARPRS